MVMELMKFKLKNPMCIWYFLWMGIIIFDRNFQFLNNDNSEFVFIIVIPICIGSIIMKKDEINSILPVSKKEMLKANVFIGILIFVSTSFLYILRMGIFNVTLQFYGALLAMIGYGCIIMTGEVLGNIKYIGNIVGYIFIWFIYASINIEIIKWSMVVTLAWIVIFIIFIYKKILENLENKGISME